MTIPDLAWYTAISTRKKLLPRCPFASVHRCPRYYQSLSLLGEAGSTPIDPDEDNALRRQWQGSDLWPATLEQATSITSIEGRGGRRRQSFWHFCPEVAFDRFGFFTSDLNPYADEIDLDLAHRALGKANAPATDPRWAWAGVSEMHYSECPLYSPLAAGEREPKIAPRRPVGFRAED